MVLVSTSSPTRARRSIPTLFGHYLAIGLKPSMGSLVQHPLPFLLAQGFPFRHGRIQQTARRQSRVGAFHFATINSNEPPSVQPRLGDVPFAALTPNKPLSAQSRLGNVLPAASTTNKPPSAQSRLVAFLITTTNSDEPQTSSWSHPLPTNPRAPLGAWGCLPRHHHRQGIPKRAIAFGVTTTLSNKPPSTQSRSRASLLATTNSGEPPSEQLRSVGSLPRHQCLQRPPERAIALKGCPSHHHRLERPPERVIALGGCPPRCRRLQRTLDRAIALGGRRLDNDHIQRPPTVQSRSGASLLVTTVSNNPLSAQSR